MVCRPSCFLKPGSCLSKHQRREPGVKLIVLHDKEKAPPAVLGNMAGLLQA